MAVIGGASSDEGFDDCSPPRAMPLAPPKPKPHARRAYVPPAECRAMESLARTLEKAATPQACAHLAVALLAHVPADMLQLVLQELDRLMRRDFIAKLPLELALKVLELLPAVDIAQNVAVVSRQWHAVAMQPYLWRRLFHRRGWRLDSERWALYCAFPRIADASRSLLHRSVAQIAEAFTAASPGALAPAVASRSSLYALEQRLDFDAARGLMDTSAPITTMDSLAAATAEAMAFMISPRDRINAALSRSPAFRIAGAGGRSPGSSRQLRPAALAHSPPLPPRRSPRLPHSVPAGRRPCARPVDWRGIYAEHHRLQANWRAGQCRVDRWEAAHPESIYCLQFDRENRLFTGSRDHTVRIWHLSETGSQITQLATLVGHAGSVLTLQADGATLATGSSDATVCVWDLKTCTIQRRLQHADAVLSLRFSDRWLVTACKDRVLHVWRRDQDYAHAFELAGHAVAINAISLHGDMLVSASGDRTVRLWDLATRTCVRTLDEHTRGVATLDFDGAYIVSGSSDRSIRIWNARTGACERTIANAHADLVRTVMFDRTMDVLVSGSYDETIKVWSFSTGALIHKFKNVHTSRVFKLMFDRTRIVSCSHDRSVSIIDFAADLPHARLLV
ncbi:hypothetical protein IWW55_004522 [Coemansia sp. RSA 2706]|nr:hypothetical protein IWW55_004522 [Coemansia sp. RSA 2706]KAJ2314860.1 hypothetical protein IWW54_000656 [Coemansia sp. RSA 2705]